jgi:hypothetical protein
LETNRSFTFNFNLPATYVRFMFLSR